MTRWSARPVLVALFVVLTIVAFGVGGRGAAAQAAGGSSPSEVIVQFSAGTSKSAMAAVASGSGVEVESSVAPSAGKAVSFAVYSSAALSVEQLVQRFQGQSGVVAVSPNYIRSIALWPNDPRLGELWGLENTGQTGGTADADIDVAAAWDAGQGSGVVVACIDTGVDYNHPDLAANMWRNPGEVPGDGIDNDGNGYIDDVYGIDTYSGDSDPMDQHGHGTHTAGTVAAVGNNGVGVAGVAWQAKVMALRFIGSAGEGTDAGAIACINYALDMKINHGVNIAVINASWGGGGYNPVLLNAIDAAANAGIVLCAAAGNSGLNIDSQPFYPASYPSTNMITVASSTSVDARSSFSNYGAVAVDLFAPGTDILSTSLGGYGLLSGTSMATPHVTGTVAILAALHPADSVATRISRILLSVDRVSALSGYCVTGGRLNAGSAVATGTPAITSVTPGSGPAGGSASVVIRGSGFVGLSGTSAVTFGGTAAASYTVDSPTQITAMTPGHSAGTVSVRVACPFGTSPDTSADDYTFILTPAVSGLAPSLGRTAGGNSVVISGTGLSGATQVLFGSAEATFNVVSGTRIDATAPAHADGSVRVRVITPGGTSPDVAADDYLYADTPVIGAVGPAMGPAAGGNSVVITGSHFTGATAVAFGGTPAASFNVDSNTQITSIAPPHSAAAVSIAVTGPAGTSADASAGDYTFVAAPAISGVGPASGPSAGGTEVLIDGSGFAGLRGASDVTFGGIAATDLTVVSDTQISATTPPGAAGPVRVQIVTAGGTTPATPAATFTYVSPLLTLYEDSNDRIPHTGFWATFFTASASAGAYSRANTGGSSAVLTFVGDRLDWIAMKGTTTGKADVYLDHVFKTTVDLAAVVATYKVNVWNTGLLPYGRHEVKIEWNPTNTPGKYITLDRVEVLGELVYPVPSITSLSPSAVSTAGGASVTIAGTGFIGVTSVMFGADPATTFTVDSQTRITATAPSHAVGSVRVQVTAAGGTTPDRSSDDFAYAVAPSLTRIDASLTAPAFVRAGTWGAYTTGSAFGGSYTRASTSGASLVIPFKGTQLDWIATKGTTTGKADVYLDNVFKTTVDLSAAVVTYKVAVWSTGILASGYHTVKIVRSASSASGKYITVDAVDVAGTLLSATRKEQTEPLILWNPAFTAWTTGATPSASGGSYKYINSAGATVTIKFTGVSLAIIARKAPSYGRMKVTVDGTTNFTVDLYSTSTSAYKKTVWQSGFLTPGDHAVTITRLGTKNASSTGYTVDLDALDLIGELK